MGDKDSAIVLLSGGQDSTTALYWAKTIWSNVKALTIHYGQRHWVEVLSARVVAEKAGVQYEEVILNQNTLKGGFLLESGDITSEYEGIAPTFVPGRNLLFLTIAANRAYIAGIKNIVIGVSQVDYSGYPDCRGEFIDSFTTCIFNATGMVLNIHTPLIDLSKADTVLLAQTIPGCYEALGYSHTCYNGMFPPCGNCPACILREKGFMEACVTDPLTERAKRFK